MTISEVETRTGLERAAVRCCEKEKLIAPAREMNGCRKLLRGGHDSFAFSVMRSGGS